MVTGLANMVSHYFYRKSSDFVLLFIKFKTQPYYRSSNCSLGVKPYNTPDLLNENESAIVFPENALRLMGLSPKHTMTLAVPYCKFLIFHSIDFYTIIKV